MTDEKPPRKRAPRKPAKATKATTRKRTAAKPSGAVKPTKADRDGAKLASVTPIKRDSDREGRNARRRQSRTSAQGLAVEERRREAMELRRMGHTYQQVADRLRELHPGQIPDGYNRIRALEDVKAMLDAVTVETVTDYLAEDLALLLAMQRSFYPAAIRGDVDAGRLMVRMLDLRAKYLGLYSPVRHQIVGANGQPVHLSLDDPAELSRAALEGLDSLLPMPEPPPLTGTTGPTE